VSAEMGEASVADRLVELLARLRRLGLVSLPPTVAGVSPSLAPLLEYLAEHPNCGVKEVANGLGLSPPTVSVALRRLEEMGLSSRRPHPRDGRAVQLYLTPAGKDTYRKMVSLRRGIATKLLAGLEPEDQEELLRLLSKALRVDAAADNPTKARWRNS